VYNLGLVSEDLRSETTDFTAEINRRSPKKSARNSPTADPPENKQPNQMQIPKTTTIKWNQFKFEKLLEVQGDRIDNSESNALLRI
jgi:hypothetical protein